MSKRSVTRECRHPGRVCDHACSECLTLNHIEAKGPRSADHHGCHSCHGSQLLPNPMKAWGADYTLQTFEA